MINCDDSTFEKVVSLLYHIANTQSQPKIDNLAKFYKKIYLHKKALNSFESFVSLVNPKGVETKGYKKLYDGMKNQSGWGEKTSALFSKTIYHFHNSEYPNNLKIWDDVPKKIIESDSFYLPVDSVIREIFKKINPDKKWSFTSINKTIKEHYKESDIEIWDDLWFWGFISQIGSGEKREMKWNLNKYWALRESDKSPKMITEIEQKTSEFLKIIKEVRTHNTLEQIIWR